MWVFFVHYPEVAGKAHDFKKQKTGDQVVRQKDADRGAHGEQGIENIAALFMAVRKVLWCEQAGHQPHQAGNRSIQCAKAVRPHGKPKPMMPGREKASADSDTKRSRQSSSSAAEVIINTA